MVKAYRVTDTVCHTLTSHCPLLTQMAWHGVLCSGATPVLPQMIRLSDLGYAPAQGVNVRDVWAQTNHSLVGRSDYTTRAIESHETILLRLSVAVGGEKTDL